MSGEPGEIEPTGSAGVAESEGSAGSAGELGAESSGETGGEFETDETGQVSIDVGQTTLDAETERVMGDAELRSALEAVLLVVDTPVSTEELATALEQDRLRINRSLKQIAADLTAANSGIDLRFAGDGWRFYTRSDFAPYVERLLLDGARTKLTRAALETLAVIAYRQPVSRARVSAIRGVNVDGVIRTLVARGLISEAGTDPTTTATLYGTTELFLERLGLASLTDLPDLAPLLPDVDVIDALSEELNDDPRFAKLADRRAQSDEAVASSDGPAPTDDQD